MSASSGAEALQIFDGDGGRGPIECAILDMHMPGMDGLQLAEALRARPRGAALPLVMLTSLGQREDHPDMALFSAFLTKPIKPSRLFNVLLSVNAVEEASSSGTGATLVDRVASTLDAALPKTARILLAEDNPNNQLVARLSLERLGYRADAVATGAEAITAVRRYAYDVVLMDMHMPELDGLDATRAIRADRSLKQPYIIAVTANASLADRDKCFEAGMDAYISKPYRLRELRRALASFGRPRPDSPEERSPRSAPCEAEPRIFDPGALDNIREILGDDDPAQLGDFVDRYVPRVGELVTQLGSAAARRDAAEMVRLTHSLKSNAAMLGATELSRLAHAVEKSRDDGSSAAVARQLEAIPSSYERFLSALKRARAEQGW